MLTANVTGTVENGDLHCITVIRSGVDLIGQVTYRVTIDGVVQQRTAEWILTTAQKNSLVANFLDSAKQAIEDHLGL